MYTLVSLIGSENSPHQELNAAAAVRARELGIAYAWRPLPEWSPDAVLAAVHDADAVIVNVEPYDAEPAACNSTVSRPFTRDSLRNLFTVVRRSAILRMGR